MSDFDNGAIMVRDLGLAEVKSCQKEEEKKGKFCSYCGQPFRSDDDNTLCPDCREF